MALLKASAKKYGQTLVVITHNEEIAQMADRTIMLADGRILSSGNSFSSLAEETARSTDHTVILSNESTLPSKKSEVSAHA